MYYNEDIFKEEFIMEHYTWKQIEREEKIDAIRQKVKDKTDKFKNFVVRNRAIIIGSAPFAIAILSELNKAANRRERIREDRRKDSRIYDPMIGDYWELRKPLSNNERLMYQERVRRGESRGSILEDMNLLK